MTKREEAFTNYTYCQGCIWYESCADEKITSLYANEENEDVCWSYAPLPERLQWSDCDDINDYEECDYVNYVDSLNERQMAYMAIVASFN